MDLTYTMYIHGWRVDVAARILLCLDLTYTMYIHGWRVDVAARILLCLGIHGSHLYYVHPRMEGRRSRVHTPLSKYPW